LTDTIQIEVRWTVKLRLLGINGLFGMVSRDAEARCPFPGRPRERQARLALRRDLESQNGIWLLHCHIPHHTVTVNDNVEEQGGGLMIKIVVNG
jgi:hypothetical protein